MLDSLPEGYEVQGTPAHGALAAQIMRQATEYRGNYIGMTIMTESMINDLIACLFCRSPKEQEFFRSILLERSLGLNFAAKIDVMSDALRARHPSIFEQFKSDGLFSRLNDIRARRNRLAHARLEVSFGYLDAWLKSMRETGNNDIDHWRFVYRRNGTERFENVTVEQAADHYQDVNRTNVRLAHLLTAIYSAQQAEDKDAPVSLE